MRTKKQSNVKRIVSVLLSALITVSTFTGLTVEAGTVSKLTLKGNLKGMTANIGDYKLSVKTEKDLYKTWFNKHYTMSNVKGECDNKLYTYGNSRDSLFFHYHYDTDFINRKFDEIIDSKDSMIKKAFSNIKAGELDQKIRKALLDESIWASPGATGFVINNTGTFGAVYYTDFFSVDTGYSGLMTPDIIDNFFLGTQVAFFRIDTQNEDPVGSREMSFSANSNNGGKKRSYSSLSTCGSIAFFVNKDCCPDPPEITSYKNSSNPLISAMVDNKNDCFTGQEKSVDYAQTTEYKPGEEFDPLPYVHFLFDSVKFVKNKGGDLLDYCDIASDLFDIADNLKKMQGSQITKDQSQCIARTLGQAQNKKLVGIKLNQGVVLPFNEVNDNVDSPINDNDDAQRSITLRTVVGDNSKEKTITEKDRNRMVIYAYRFSVKFNPKPLNVKGQILDVEAERDSASDVKVEFCNERSTINYTISNFPKIGVKPEITLYETKSVNLKNLSGLTWHCQVSEEDTANSENANVFSAGIVTGLKAGTATIALTKKIQDTTYTEYCKVTVKKAIKNFKLSATTGSITATWDKSAMSANANCELAIKKANSNGRPVTKSVEANTTSYKFDKNTLKTLPIEENTGYRVSIKPYITRNGTKIYGTESTGYINTCKGIGAVTSIKVEENLPRTMTISWNKVDDITGYNIVVKDITDNNNQPSERYQRTENKIIIPNLQPGHRYSINVEAYKTFPNKETFYGLNKVISKYTPVVDLSQYTVKLNKTHYNVTGNEITPDILSVKDKNGNMLRKGTDYTFQYKDNISSGKAYVVVKGKGSFSGQKLTSFQIDAPALSKPENFKVTSKRPESISVSWNKVSNATGYELVIYDTTSKGSQPHWSEPTLGTSYTFANLKCGHSYAINVRAYFEDKNRNVYKGSDATLGREVYTPEKNISDYYITLSGNSFSYTGNQIKPNVLKVYDSNGNVLVKNTDYTVSYGENKYVGKGKVTITGKSPYIGSQTVEFDIKKPALAKPATLTATKSGSKITLNWSKVNSAAGYEILAEVHGDYHDVKWYERTVSGNVTSYTFSNLEGNCVYFYVRAYVFGAQGQMEKGELKNLGTPIDLD